MVKSPGKKKNTKAGVKPAIDVAIDAMMTLVGQLGWRDVTLSDIAAEAGMNLAELHQIARSKPGLLGAFVTRTDQALLKNGAVDTASEPVKDRLFDVVMQRLDLLQPWRDAIKAIARDIPFDPLTAICLGKNRRTSMIWMLEMTGVSASGLKGKMRIAGLDLILLSTMRVWLKDESADLSVTMAHLDRQLSRADRLVQSLRNGRLAKDREPQTDPV
jgi:ubiquinone biosynthesis protein COQ9